VNDIIFDEGKAEELKSQLKSEIESIKNVLNSIKQKVEAVRDWWKGGSEEGFIRNFNETQKKIIKQLEEWLKSYQDLMKQTVAAKREVEAAEKAALEKAISV